MSASSLAVLPRPVLLVAPERDDASYLRAYTITGDPGSVALQRVSTRIEYRCGEETLASYTGTYTEYFRFAADGSLGRLSDGRVLHDIHDFDLRRDGWCLQGLRRLVRAQDVRTGEGALCPRVGEAVLTCEKRYLLGPAEVEETQPARETPDGGAFGYLAHPPGAPPQATLTLGCCQAGATRSIALSTPAPSPHPLAGRGRFTGSPCWGASEHYTYTFALQRGALDAVDYTETPAPQEDSWNSPTKR